MEKPEATLHSTATRQKSAFQKMDCHAAEAMIITCYMTFNQV